MFREATNEVRNWEHPEIFEVLEASEFRRMHSLRKDRPSVVSDIGGALPVEWH